MRATAPVERGAHRPTQELLKKSNQLPDQARKLLPESGQLLVEVVQAWKKQCISETAPFSPLKDSFRLLQAGGFGRAPWALELKQPAISLPWAPNLPPEVQLWALPIQRAWGKRLFVNGMKSMEGAKVHIERPR